MELPEIVYLESTESTNDDVVSLARKGAPHLSCVCADFQSNGRGRRGNSWVAPAGSNLLFSILLRLDCDPLLWHRVPQIAGMALINTVENQYSKCEDIKLKWPNDLYYCDMKWSGILAESKLEKNPFMILGVGVNCLGNSSNYPPDLQNQVTTLEQIFAQSEINRLQLLKSFRDQLAISIDSFLIDFAPVVEFCNRRDYLIDRRITVQSEGQEKQGIGVGVNAEGHLMIRQSDGELLAVQSGTVSEIL